MVTVLPCEADIGENEVILGDDKYVNPVKLAVPPAEVTVMFPLEPNPT